MFNHIRLLKSHLLRVTWRIHFLVGTVCHRILIRLYSHHIPEVTPAAALEVVLCLSQTVGRLRFYIV